MQAIKIHATDTLFFRDTRPFNRGEQTEASGIFPPYPSTIYGSLYGRYFAENPELFTQVNLSKSPELAVTNCCIGIDNTPCTPLPLDLLEQEDQLSFLVPEQAPHANINLSHILTAANKDVNKKTDGTPYFSFQALADYLTGNNPSYDSKYDLTEYFTRELKPGIRVDANSGTVDPLQGELYYLDFYRPEAYKKIDYEEINTNTMHFHVEFEGIPLKEQGNLKLGGEGKTAIYEAANNIQEPTFPLDDSDTYFKMYIATPALFQNGWLPEWVDPEKLEGTVYGVKLKLVTAATGKPQLIGGFDMVKKEPKPLKKAVPAGSIYIFKVEGGNPSELSAIHAKCISDERYQEGFGKTYLGKLSNEQLKALKQ